MLTADWVVIVSVVRGLWPPWAARPLGCRWPQWALRRGSSGVRGGGRGAVIRKIWSQFWDLKVYYRYFLRFILISYLWGCRSEKLPLTKFKCSAVRCDSWPSKKLTQPVKLESDWWRKSTDVIKAVYKWNWVLFLFLFQIFILACVWFKSYKNMEVNTNWVWVYHTWDWLIVFLIAPQTRSSDLNTK